MDGMTYEQLIALAKTVLEPTILLSIAGTIISLLTSYIPKFREWYAALTDVQKSLGQLLAVTAVCLLAGIVSWLKLIPIIPADTSGLLLLAFAWLNALQANQATYKLSPQVESVRTIKDTQTSKDLEKVNPA